MFIGTTRKPVIRIHKFRCDFQKFWPHCGGLWVVGPLQFSVEAHACSCAFLREKGSPGYIFHRKTTLFLGKIAIYFLLCYAGHNSIEVLRFFLIYISYYIDSKVTTIWFPLQCAKGTLWRLSEMHPYDATIRSNNSHQTLCRISWLSQNLTPPKTREHSVFGIPHG